MFSMEWPPRSGKTAEFPEVDKAGWFDLDEALAKVTKGQRPIIAALADKLAQDKGEPSRGFAGDRRCSGPQRRIRAKTQSARPVSDPKRTNSVVSLKVRLALERTFRDGGAMYQIEIPRDAAGQPFVC